jgi:hypothetical protein
MVGHRFERVIEITDILVELHPPPRLFSFLPSLSILALKNQEAISSGTSVISANLTHCFTEKRIVNVDCSEKFKYHKKIFVC